jgi:hypothetical protein
MRSMITAVADRMLGLVAPSARAGACACQQEVYYQYRCLNGQLNQRRRCQVLCNCNVRCDPWVTIGDC